MGVGIRQLLYHQILFMDEYSDTWQDEYKLSLRLHLPQRRLTLNKSLIGAPQNHKQQE